MTRDQELWAIALWLEEKRGEAAPDYIARQITRLALAGDDAGIAMWRTVAERYDQLGQTQPPS